MCMYVYEREREKGRDIIEERRSERAGVQFWFLSINDSKRHEFCHWVHYFFFNFFFLFFYYLPLSEIRR